MLASFSHSLTLSNSRLLADLSLVALPDLALSYYSTSTLATNPTILSTFAST